MKRLVLNSPNIQDQRGELHSVYPCTEYLTFGAWIYLVPQYKPKSVLMLGYGGGTSAGLIRMFYGDVPITAVDMDDCSDFNYYDVELIEQDAREFMRDTDRHFDSIIIDLFREGEYYPEPFVRDPEFVKDLERCGNYIILHDVKGQDISAYDHLHKVRSLDLNRPDKYNPIFHYFMVNDVPIPIR